MVFVCLFVSLEEKEDSFWPALEDRELEDRKKDGKRRWSETFDLARGSKLRAPVVLGHALGGSATLSRYFLLITKAFCITSPPQIPSDFTCMRQYSAQLL